MQTFSLVVTSLTALRFGVWVNAFKISSVTIRIKVRVKFEMVLWVCECFCVYLCVWTGHFISRAQKQITSLSLDQSSPPKLTNLNIPVKAHGWLPPNSQDCLFKCKGNQVRQAAGIHRARERERDRERQMGSSQGKGARTGHIDKSCTFFLSLVESYSSQSRILIGEVCF